MKEPCTCGTAFSFKKYCPSLVIAVKMLIRTIRFSCGKHFVLNESNKVFCSIEHFVRCCELMS